jgi:predicted permease
METLLKDIRYGLRGLLKRPGFTAVAIITLALGIGANTAIFTLVNAVMLKSLPVSNPEELVLFNESSSEGTSMEDSPRTGVWRRFSNASYQYFRNHNESFQDLMAFRSGESPLSVRQTGTDTNAPAQKARGHLVSGNYFSVLGASPRRGRALTPEDDKPNAQPVAVISNGYWERELNSDPAAVGKNLILNGTNFTIVGLMPPEFFGERVRRSPDFWLPLAFHSQIELRPSYLNDNQAYWLMFMGRLKPGVTIEQAQTNVNFTLRQFLTEQAGSQLTEERQRGIQNTSVSLAPGRGGISGLRLRYSKPLRMLMAIVGMVLLISCANVGSLLLSRAASRKAEISLRMALGATRRRIIRQLLTESLLLAVVGGVFGIVLSHWGVKLLVSLVIPDSPIDTHPDLRILLFTTGVSIVAGLLFGLAPAIRSSQSDLASAMKEKTRTGAGRLRLNLSSALVVIQVALSMVLLTGAGLFARSMLNLQSEDVGFDRSSVLLVGVDPRLANYKPAELSSLYQQLFDRLSAVPNVKSVSMATYAPMSGSNRTSSIKVQGYTPVPGEDTTVQDLLIGPNYNASLGVSLLQGRAIGVRDTPASGRVAVVNETFAEHYFKDQNPIGRMLTFDDETDKGAYLEIVGVIGDVKSSDPREQPQPAVFRPILQIQDDAAYAVSFIVRTVAEPSNLAPVARSAITQIAPQLPITEVTTLNQQMRERLLQDRLITQLVSFFGVLALLLACVGLYGVMAHAVARRTNEIGIRMALGARGNNIVWMVLREVLTLVIGGLLIGLPTALFAARFVSSQLFGLKPSDPVTLVAAAVTLTVVALLAGFVPARRAARVNPLIALRYE